MVSSRFFVFLNNGNPEPVEAEAWGLHQAMIWLQNEMCTPRIIFERDCKNVVDGFCSNTFWISLFHLVLCPISHLSIILHRRIRPPEAEAMALYHAMSWAKNLGLHNILFETDCKSLVDTILKTQSDSSDLSVIISKCKTILSNLVN